MNADTWFRILPCRHGERCNECAERKRLAKAKAEKDAERQAELQREYARQHRIAVRCPDCGDIHPPHER